MSELYFFICERMLLVFVSGFRAFWVYVRVVFFYLRENAIGFRFWVYGLLGLCQSCILFICERMLLVFVSGFRAFWVYVRVVFFLSARECYWFSFLG